MAIDKLIEIAISDSIAEYKQPQTLSPKLIKWLENSMNGKEDPLDPSSYRTHLSVIFNIIEIDNESSEEIE